MKNQIFDVFNEHKRETSPYTIDKIYANMRISLANKHIITQIIDQNQALENCISLFSFYYLKGFTFKSNLRIYIFEGFILI